MILVAHNYSPKVTQPRKQPLNFPPPFVTPEFSAVLRFRSFPIRFVRRNQLDVEFFQLFIERIRVIRFIANHLFWSLIGKSLADGSLDKFDFVRRSRFGENGERKTKAVCHCHELRTLPRLVAPTQQPLFWRTQMFRQ